MPQIDLLFVTRVYRASLGSRLASEIARAALALAASDKAGQAWCRANDYSGYTSYASLDDLPWRFPEFAALAKRLDAAVRSFADTLDFDLAGRALELDSMWANVMPHGAVHTSHIHPHSVISGTFYAALPQGASAIRFEDPRLGLMMAAPARRGNAARINRQFVYVKPKAGTLLLWESWLRHEVPVNRAKSERISVSFNYRWT
ncbi:MAG TPA: TIGR02466 family protein [Aestuariivirgaceae bacterium]|jgi:uncharacterized protein (TIGR02466 family)